MRWTTPADSLSRRPAPGTLLAACAVSVALLGACALPPSHPAEPVFPVAVRYGADGDDADRPGIDPALTGWRTYFAEPRLQGLIERALRNNRDLRSAALRVQEARATFGIQRAAAWPAVDASAGWSRVRVPADGQLIGGALLASGYQAGAALLNWEIDFWGRLGSLQDAALQEYLATGEARRALAISLVAQVVKGDLALRELDERVLLAQETSTSRQENVRISTRRVAVGATSRLELMQVKTLLTQAQALHADLQQSRAAALQALCLLVGEPLTLPANTAPPPHLILPEVRAGLPSALLQQRPDILAAEHQLHAAQANIGAARAAYFPRITLTSAAGLMSPALGHLVAWPSRAWLLSPGIALPLFDGGRRRNALTVADVRRDLAIAAYEKTVQIAFREVSDALSARRWQAEQVTLASTAMAEQTERARLARIRYARGATAFLDVLDAERELLGAQQQLVHARSALLGSYVSLYAALGGGACSAADCAAEGVAAGGSP